MTSVKQRESGIELFRIVSMLLIIAHHYVVNSGLTKLIYQDLQSIQAMFYLVFGGWGKMGINCFVLITGYFMCKLQISLNKFLKLIFEILFYNIVIYCLFVLSGYEIFSKRGLLGVLFPVTLVSNNFLSCYLLFYLCIPFLNVLICNISEKMHIRLIALGVFIYTILGSAAYLSIKLQPLQFGTTMNYVSWFIVLYFIASYIRCYPKAIFNRINIWGLCTLCFIGLSILSIILSAKNPYLGPYYFVADSNKILALLTSVSMFLYFKNLHLKHNHIINAMGASTFGVLMIHANSDAMRRWLWSDVLHNTSMYGSKWLVCHAVISVVAIFVVCAVLDQLRIRFIEGPMFKKVDTWLGHFIVWFNQQEEHICRKLNIGEKT